MNIRLVQITACAVFFSTAVNAADGEDPGLRFTLGLRETYDDNLYRLAENLEPSNVLGPAATRSDYVSRVTAGLDQRWQWSRQQVLVDIKGNHDAYRNNQHLDNTSGAARASWQWQAGGRLSGEFAGDYSRSLASFANTQFLGLDLVDVQGASGMLAFQLGAQWSLRLAARHADTEHSAVGRRFDNSDTETGSAGLQFKTASGNEFALSYRATRAGFEQPGSLNGAVFDRDFEEHVGSFRMHYVFSEKTTFDGSFGQLEREYANAAIVGDSRGSFSGGVWDAALQWDPTIKIRFELAGWRKLRAYLDAESDYFVAEGGRVVASWHPTDRFGVAFESGYEDQDYLGIFNALVPERRHDRVISQELTVSYRALRKLHFDLTGRIEDRDSNRAPLQYDTQVASVGVRWVY